MQQLRRSALALVVVALSVVSGVRAKDADEIGPYRLITTILIPGFGNGFDISWVDSEAVATIWPIGATPPQPRPCHRESTSSIRDT